nr:MAG TPA: hypothetical protein [Bacteriophage sp.]
MLRNRFHNDFFHDCSPLSTAASLNPRHHDDIFVACSVLNTVNSNRRIIIVKPCHIVFTLDKQRSIRVIDLGITDTVLLAIRIGFAAASSQKHCGRKRGSQCKSSQHGCEKSLKAHFVLPFLFFGFFLSSFSFLLSVFLSIREKISSLPP